MTSWIYLDWRAALILVAAVVVAAAIVYAASYFTRNRSS